MKCIITIEYERGNATIQEMELLSQLLGLPTVTKSVVVAENPKNEAQEVRETNVESVESVAEEKEPEITQDDIRKLCMEKAKTNRDGVKDILAKYGAQTIFTLPKDKYKEFKKAVEKL